MKQSPNRHPSKGGTSQRATTEQRKREETSKGRKGNEKEQRETEKNDHINDGNEQANNKTEREIQSKHKHENTQSKETNNSRGDPEKVEEKQDIEYTTESDLFDSDSEFGDKTLDAPETIAVKEAKFYLSIWPQNNSNFDP